MARRKAQKSSGSIGVKERQTIRAISRRMTNGDVLVLGRNVDEASEMSDVVGQALALGLLPGFVLCLLSGAWLSVRAQRRVEEVNQRVRRIIAGDLRSGCRTVPSTSRSRSSRSSSTACWMKWKR
jgi:hypothetical protein